MKLRNFNLLQNQKFNSSDDSRDIRNARFDVFSFINTTNVNISDNFEINHSYILFSGRDLFVHDVVVGYMIYYSEEKIKIKLLSLPLMNLFIIFDKFYVKNSFNFIIKTLSNYVIYRSRSYDEKQLEESIKTNLKISNIITLTNPLVKIFLLTNQQVILSDYECLIIGMLFNKLLKKDQLIKILDLHFKPLKNKSKKYYDKIVTCYNLIMNKDILQIKNLDKSYEHIYLRLLYINMILNQDMILNQQPPKLSIDLINGTLDNQIIYILLGIIKEMDLNKFDNEADLLQILTEYYKSGLLPTSKSESIAGGFNNKYNKYDKYKQKYEKYKLKYINLKKQITNI
jgi:hypothetical protein